MPIYEDKKAQQHRQRTDYQDFGSTIQTKAANQQPNFAAPTIQPYASAEHLDKFHERLDGSISNKPNVPLQAYKHENTKWGKSNTNAPVQMVMKPHIVVNYAHMRQFANGKVTDGMFGKGKIGERLKPNDEIEADPEATFINGKWLKAQKDGIEGVIRANKVVAKDVMTPESIDALSDEAPKTDKLATADKVFGIGKKGTKAGKDTLKELPKLNRFDKDSIENAANQNAMAGGTIGAFGDLTEMFMAGRKLKKTWMEKRWDWDLASTGLKILKSLSSMVTNTGEAIVAGSKIIGGTAAKLKDPAKATAELFNKVSGSVGALKGILDTILAFVKFKKKKDAKTTTKFSKNMAGLGSSIIKLLKEFKAVDKEGKFFKTSIPFLGMIMNGAEAVLSWIKVEESEETAVEMSGKSAALRNEILGMVGNGQPLSALTGSAGDHSKLFHTEKRGMMFYRKEYYRINPYLLGSLQLLQRQSLSMAAKAKSSILDKCEELENRSQSIPTKAYVKQMKLIAAQSENLEDLKNKVIEHASSESLQNEDKDDMTRELLDLIDRKQGHLKGVVSKTAKNVTYNDKVAERLAMMASTSQSHPQLRQLIRTVQEYELSDKLSEINQKRQSVGREDRRNAIINVISDLMGSIGAFFTAGWSTVTGKVAKGAASAYKGGRAASKFLQKHVGRKYGILGGDKNRSKAAKHKEYVAHAKFLTKLWIDEAETADLDTAKGSLDKNNENKTDGLKKVKNYVDATGLKAQDAVEAPAMQIPDMMVEAMKER